jgi:hypothetical protein
VDGPIADPDVLVEGDPEGIYSLFVDRCLDAVTISGDQALLDALTRGGSAAVRDARNDLTST